MKKNLLLSILFSLITLGCLDNSKKINNPKLIKGFAEKEALQFIARARTKKMMQRTKNFQSAMKVLQRFQSVVSQWQ